MILACPFCGFDIEPSLKDGFCLCNKCNKMFDSNPFHRLLSVCWYIRKHNVNDLEQLSRHGISDYEGLIGLALAYDGEYSHDEVVQILRKLGISENATPNY